MLDKEHKNFDACSVSTPDHMHAVIAMAAMQLKKHVYVQKPLTHDINEARVLTESARKFKVVTQMVRSCILLVLSLSKDHGLNLQQISIA